MDNNPSPLMYSMLCVHHIIEERLEMMKLLLALLLAAMLMASAVCGATMDGMAEYTPEPTFEATEAPSMEPTPEPTPEPTEAPTEAPTEQPTEEPTQEPFDPFEDWYDDPYGDPDVWDGGWADEWDGDASCDDDDDIGGTVGAVDMINPWQETTAEEIIEDYGYRFSKPRGAQNVSYSALPDARLAQMQFDIGKIELTARAMGGDPEDISGAYYGRWDAEEVCDINGCETKLCSVRHEDGAVALCQWYDGRAEVNYCVMAEAEDLEGFDLVAVARQVFKR